MESHKKIKTLSNYFDIIDSLNFGFFFNFHNEHYDNELNNIIQEDNIDGKKNTGSAREHFIANAWEKVFPLKEKLYFQALSQRYANIRLVSKFYFRGLSNISYLNVSGIYRGNLANTRPENYFFNEMQVRCPSSFAGMKNINKLTYMQHYGCPTRLLDISSNPLVALYFACCNNDDKDGVVYVFGVPENDIHYEQSDRVQMLSKLAEFKADEQEQLLILSYIYLLKRKFPQSSNGKYLDTVIERFYHAIKRDNGAFEREMDPLDLLKPLFVQVNKDNPRILKQDGAFIMSGLDLNENDSNEKIDCYVTSRIVIPSEEKKSLLNQLERVCINQASLFPEVDQVASYLKTKIG